MSFGSGPQQSWNGAEWNAVAWNGVRPPALDLPGAYPDATRGTCSRVTTVPEPAQATWTVKAS